MSTHATYNLALGRTTLHAPDKLYLEVHAQHVKALVIAAIQYETPQGIRMLPECLQHLIKLLDGTAPLTVVSFPGQHDRPERCLKQHAVGPTVVVAVLLVVCQQACATAS